MRNRLHDSRDDLRQSLYQRNQQVNACLNNERYRIQHRVDNAVNDFRDGFHDCHNDIRQCGNKRGQKLNACFNDLRNRIQ